MGARIKVAKTNGEIIGTYTTDANGLVTIKDLEAGSYTITEIAAPDGYILDMTPQIVELKAGESKQIELFNTAKPGLQLRKIDKLTNKPVANAVFSLVKLESGAKRDIGTYTTGENGLFYIPDLAPGNYVLTEITAPAGYILDPTPQNIYIEGGKLNTVEVFNIPYSSLRILKISADDERKPLAGAIFKLFDELRLEIGTYETSALGEIMIPQLPAGNYYLQETKAPAGYILDSTVHKIELIGGKTTENRLPGNINVSFEGVESESLIMMLDQNGVAASSGSACTSGTLEPSHVLLSIGVPREIAGGSLRLSINGYTTGEDVEHILKVLPPAVERLRKI